jgi:hypothetical protein
VKNCSVTVFLLTVTYESFDAKVEFFFFFCLNFSDTILKKYSSTVATIFTGLASAALLGHTLTLNFLLGVSIVFISMHQVLNLHVFVLCYHCLFYLAANISLFLVLFPTSQSQG